MQKKIKKKKTIKTIKTMSVNRGLNYRKVLQEAQ
jgi:hypothetical protein